MSNKLHISNKENQIESNHNSSQKNNNEIKLNTFTANI
jgi:hypothetical protein